MPTLYEVVKRRGSFIEPLPGAPRFEDRSKAEEWAAVYLADHRDEFQQGLEAIEVRPLRRPADVIGNAIKVARIATGEEEEDMPPDDGKDKAAQEMGRKGAKARADKLSPERRAEIARKAAAKRWKRT